MIGDLYAEAEYGEVRKLVSGLVDAVSLIFIRIHIHRPTLIIN